MADDIEDLKKKYKAKMDVELGKPVEEVIAEENEKPVSVEYLEFKREIMPKHMTWYEKACRISEKVLNMKPDEKKAAQLREAFESCHLDVTPTGAVSFSYLAPIAIILFGVLLTMFLFQGDLFLIMFWLAFGGLMIGPASKIPFQMASSWRMKASNEMVLSIFYIVSYMRHTSNLELAIEFASRHLDPPLSLDLKKIMWDVETEKYESVKESLDMYLASWKKYNAEYIEAMHLVESSLYEGDESRRISMLDKSLTVILEGTYEKMLHFAQNLKSPMQMLYMLCILLPILGLVILPLMVSFMEGVRAIHIAALYNIGLPIAVFLMGKGILTNRPSGYGNVDISSNPEFKKLTKKKINIAGMQFSIEPLYLSIGIAVICVIIGTMPLWLNALNFPDFGFGPVEKDNPIVCGQRFCFMEYKESSKAVNADGTPKIIGPFGLGASVISIVMILGLGLSLGMYYKLRSKNVIEIRKQSEKLEMEFGSALFQLGNRLGDGLPTEMAFGKVAASMEGTVSASFFQKVAQNIQRLGMGVDEAIFDKQHGALTYYPSNLIESSMKVLTESARKGPEVAAQALINISQYLKQIHKVNERLKDLLAETIQSMKSQINFMAPIISGIVIGITSMITSILSRLGTQMKAVSAASGAAGAGGATSLMGLFGDGLPSFYFQLIVGIYIIELAFILTILVNGIENGEDKLNERYLIGQNVTRATIRYCAVALIVTIAFNIIAASIMARG